MTRYTVLVRLPVGNHEFTVRADSKGHALRVAAHLLDARGFKVRDVKNILVSEVKDGKPC